MTTTDANYQTLNVTISPMSSGWIMRGIPTEAAPTEFTTWEIFHVGMIDEVDFASALEMLTSLLAASNTSGCLIADRRGIPCGVRVYGRRAFVTSVFLRAVSK